MLFSVSLVIHARIEYAHPMLAISRFPGKLHGLRLWVKFRLYGGLFVLALPLFSCAARISGPLRADGSAELALSASLEPRMTSLIRNLAAAAGAQPDKEPVLDGPAIARSMSAAPGIASVSFINTSPAAIEGPVRVAQIGEVLATGKTGAQGFINFEQNKAGGRCIISISLETGPEILSLFSPQISDYLSALMAPIASGEALSKTEYLSLVSVIYGGAIADEISRSAIHASIEFPGQILSVKGGSFSGRRADFNIPLPDLLVLETPLLYEVAWN